MQLRPHRTVGAGATPVGTTSSADVERTLAQLVTAAAAAAPAVPAICKPGLTVSFGELADRAIGAAGTMSGDSTIDDSALTMVLMMTVPGLALSGPSGLAATLSSIRVQASMAVAGAQGA